tara:strand:- start:12938 stop:13144 length:207 start_codon:yes stop_codon:yes gene_type:complete
MSAREGITNPELAKMFGCTHQNVQRIEHKMFDKFRKAFLEVAERDEEFREFLEGHTNFSEYRKEKNNE